MTELVRRLTLTDAVLLGLGSMVGAGVFVVWAPAAAAAGSGLFAGLALAALVAYCNATSSAQLAAAHPTSGGTYVYGRAELNAWWGFVAGWGFVVGKTASAAAMALTVASYLAPPGGWQPIVAVGTVWALTAVNLRGITRTALATRVIVAFVAATLLAVVVGGLGAWSPPAVLPAAGPAGAYGVLQSAGLLFFAFAGYARIATLGEEVVDPRRTIPRAIPLALGLAVVLYVAVGVVVTGVLGVDALAASRAPVADAAASGGTPWLVPVVRVAAAVAASGALLALVAGIGRTALAMAREGDLPSALAAVHPVHRVPHVAELTVATVVSGLVFVGGLREVIGFSSFGVLVYYFVANRAALAQRSGRRYPRPLQALGLVLCAALVVTLPWQSVVAGVGMYALGIGYRLVRLRRRRSAGTAGA